MNLRQGTPIFRIAETLKVCLVIGVMSFLTGCLTPPPPELTPTLPPLPTLPPTPTPPPPPAPPAPAGISPTWQLYVTGMLVGDAAAPLVERLALPDPEAGQQWLLLNLTLENISGTWLTLPYEGGLSGSLLDSGGRELALAGVNFAPYTQLPAGQDIYLAPRFQAAGLAWAKIPVNQTPTDVWLSIDDNRDGQAEQILGVSLIKEQKSLPPLFNAIQLPVSSPGTVFDFPHDLRATITSIHLEPAVDDQFQVRVDLELENTSSAPQALDGNQFAQIWGIDKSGRYFCCLAGEAGQGGDFGPDQILAPGQTAAGFLMTWPFTPETGVIPEALLMVTIRGRTNAVTEIFLAPVKEDSPPPLATTAPAAALIPANLSLTEANALAVTDNTAYLTDSAGLHLLDVANPTAPQEISFYPAESAAGLVVDGSIAYLLADGQLHLVDIANPAGPQQLGLYPLPGGPAYLAVAGQMGYLGAGQVGLVALDLADPAAPREVARIAGDTSKVAVLGQRVYAVDAVDTLRIFDVADPAHPHLLGAFHSGDVITDLVVQPSPVDPSMPLAYLGTLGQGVRLVDVSNPAGPHEIGAYSTKGSAYSLALAGNRLYVANGWAVSGLSVVDVSQPAKPVEVAFIPAAREWDSFVDVAAASVPGGINVYIANRFEGLLVYSDNP